tara:strand:+ start:812 stop:1090 length:279 start_codon:yes stop_codon:yes gene_type:complete
MKKILIIIFISLLFSHTSNAKLSNEAWNDVYGGCYDTSEKTKFFNQYCTCFVNGFDAKFSDEELDRYLRTTKDVTKDPLFIKITQQCYDKYK